MAGKKQARKRRRSAGNHVGIHAPSLPRDLRSRDEALADLDRKLHDLRTQQRKEAS
jgi:hypothetical protein